jgi:hypothetical protein
VAAEASREASGQWRLWRRGAGESRVVAKRDDVDLTESGLGECLRTGRGRGRMEGPMVQPCRLSRASELTCRARPSSLVRPVPRCLSPLPRKTL